MAINPQSTIAGPARRQETLPAAVWEHLVLHNRPAGTCLIYFLPGGTIACHDAGAGVFFERYVIPALRHPDVCGQALAGKTSRIEPGSPPQIWELVPGVLISALPHVERRQVRGILAIAARSEGFRLGEDVLRLCSMFGLDATWLAQQARHVPAHTAQHLGIGNSVMLSLLTDRLRLNALEQELNTLSTQLANAYEELTLIEQISGGMRVNRRSADFFRQACLDVMQVMQVRGMGVVVRSDKLEHPPVLYGDLSLPPGQVHRLADELLPMLRTRKNFLLVNDLAADKRLGWLGEFASRLIAVPMLRGEQVLGCLFGLDKLAGDFDSVDAKLLTSISNESAIYLENAILFGDVHGLMMGLLHSLTSAVDAKDAYTCGHSERVALLARHVARQLSLDDYQVERTYMAGLLHDVGKIGIPESVLQKTGRLTPEEFEVMKKHPLIGARILADVKEMADVVPGVLHHHERYDGRGYPNNLAGKSIPLVGRIICLADCFDAMTSNRTYRRALPLEVALTEIRRCSGTQFDPELAEIFLAIRPDDFRALLRDHQLAAKRLLELQESLRAA